MAEFKFELVSPEAFKDDIEFQNMFTNDFTEAVSKHFKYRGNSMFEYFKEGIISEFSFRVATVSPNLRLLLFLEKWADSVENISNNPNSTVREINNAKAKLTFCSDDEPLYIKITQITVSDIFNQSGIDHFTVNGYASLLNNPNYFINNFSEGSAIMIKESCDLFDKFKNRLFFIKSIDLEKLSCELEPNNSNLNFVPIKEIVKLY